MTEVPSWMVGTGLETDMSGDPRGSGSFLRYWMPKSTSRKLVFLTDGDKAPVIWEHQVQLNGSWKNWFTCLQPLGRPCPLCQFAAANNNKYSRSKVCLFTVIDTAEFTDKNGKARKNERRLFVAKQKITEKLKRRCSRLMEKGLNLRGALFEVYRTGDDQSPGTGEDFEYVEHVDLSVFPEVDEFDYSELAPDPEKVTAVAESLRAGMSWSASPPKSEGTSAEVEY